MSNTTIVFALVGLVGFAVGVLSLMYAVNANSRSRRLEMTWETSKPAKLAAEVVDLAAALDASKRATRAEFGKVWQKFAGFEPARPPPVETYEPTLAPDLEVCEHWAEAQLHGPRSEAARCMCGYCLRMRSMRAAEKARILAERSRAKANGSE